MTEIDPSVGRAQGPRPALDRPRPGQDIAPPLLHTELDHSARIVTTIIGALTDDVIDDIVGYLLTLPLLPDVVDCRYVHRVDPAAVAALWRVLARTDAIVRPSAALQAIDAVDPRYDLTGIDVPLLHRCETGVAVHDADLRFVYVNKRLASINGVSADRHRNRTCSELLRPSHDTVTAVLQRCLDDRTAIRCIVDTAAESWACRYVPARHRIDGSEQDFVVALVSPPWSADGTYLTAPSARLIYKRAVRAHRRRHLWG